jgi:hypothetical protein
LLAVLDLKLGWGARHDLGLVLLGRGELAGGVVALGSLERVNVEIDIDWVDFDHGPGAGREDFVGAGITDGHRGDIESGFFGGVSDLDHTVVATGGRSEVRSLAGSVAIVKLLELVGRLGASVESGLARGVGGLAALGVVAFIAEGVPADDTGATGEVWAEGNVGLSEGSDGEGAEKKDSSHND